MVGLNCHDIVAAPLEEVVRSAKMPREDMLRLAEMLGI